MKQLTVKQMADFISGSNDQYNDCGLLITCYISYLFSIGKWSSETSKYKEIDILDTIRELADAIRYVNPGFNFGRCADMLAMITYWPDSGGNMWTATTADGRSLSTIVHYLTGAVPIEDSIGDNIAVCEVIKSESIIGSRYSPTNIGNFYIEEYLCRLVGRCGLPNGYQQPLNIAADNPYFKYLGMEIYPNLGIYGDYKKDMLIQADELIDTNIGRFCSIMTDYIKDYSLWETKNNMRHA